MVGHAQSGKLINRKGKRASCLLVLYVDVNVCVRARVCAQACVCVLVCVM